MSTKQPRHVALIDLADYPRAEYAAYWEIFVEETDAAGDGYDWRARLYAYEGDGQVLAEHAGRAATRDEADTAAQSWVIQQMKGRKRPAPPANPQAGYALTLGPLDMVRELFERLFGWLFALAFSTTVRNNRLNAVRDAVDGGAGAGLLRIYDGSRPATGGTATTLLAELTFSDPCAPAASSGSATWNSITQDSSANATGTATWFRCVDSTATFVMDGNVGTSGSDLNLNTTSITSGVAVSVTSFALTDGNA
jgi:hypothetical protein